MELCKRFLILFFHSILYIVSCIFYSNPFNFVTFYVFFIFQNLFQAKNVSSFVVYSDNCIVIHIVS